jgi:A/G-specific adenine glycosylase
MKAGVNDWAHNGTAKHNTSTARSVVFITYHCILMRDMQRLRRRLLAWYAENARDLPWRRTRDPYRIWVSEIMLQQTRVAAAEPYYRRFIDRFPDCLSLARAPESEVLRLWSGRGYYSRARHLHRAARHIAAAGGAFPRDYASIRALPGVGDYTAAAVASIAFGLPHAVLDGNVRRVLSRLVCGSQGLPELAGQLLDRARPGDWNQALMELGATVCLPREPRCERCPLSGRCRARREGRQAEFPARKSRPRTVQTSLTLLIVERRGRVLLTGRGGFWEIPQADLLPDAQPGPEIGRFRHAIMNRSYVCTVFRATARGIPAGLRWVARAELSGLPLGTLTRKALALLAAKGPRAV